MKWGFLSCTIIGLCAAIYVFRIDGQVETSLEKQGEQRGNGVSGESMPFISKSVATTDSVLKPLESKPKERINDSEIKLLEQEMSDSIEAYNKSITSGHPDADAIEKIAALKEKFKQRALQGVRENNK